MAKFHLSKSVPSTPEEVETIIKTLEQFSEREVTEEWFFELSALQCQFNDAWFNAFWQKSQDSSSKEAMDWFTAIAQTYIPQFEAAFAAANKKAQLVNVEPARLQLMQTRMQTASLPTPESVELNKQIMELENEYQKVESQQTIDYGGIVNLTTASRLLGKEANRGTRQEIWTSLQERKKLDTERTEEMMVKLVELRSKVSKVSGNKDFRAYCWDKKGRTSYTADDALNLLSITEHLFDSSYKKLAKAQGEILGITELEPWDIHAFNSSIPLHNRVFSESDYATFTETAFSSIHSEFGPIISGIFNRGHADLLTRKNKIASNFCGSFLTVNEPLVSCNLTGETNQLTTLFHEFGHAVHHNFANTNSLYHERSAPFEIGEFVANSFQLLGYDLLEKINYTSDEALNFRISFLVERTNLIREITSLERLQHWIYTQPKPPTIESINTMHIKLSQDSSVNWGDFEVYRPLGWHHTHVISLPFYTIEYVIAWVGALIFYEQYSSNKPRAIQKLINVMKMGNTKDAKSLFAMLDIPFPFAESDIKKANLSLDNMIFHIIG
ncbi:MAG: M3 family metallopeptidase [Trueperaceae bacterium]